jgi:hypothetical protein
MPIEPGIYEHYKGKKYRVIGVAKDADSLEDYVVYEALYPNKLSKFWVRSVQNFSDEVLINGKKVKRYKYLGEK